MPSERIQRQVDRLLDEAEAAVSEGNWQLAGELTRRVLTLDPESVASRNHPSIDRRSWPEASHPAPAAARPIEPD
ncbi:MAG TPA: hypothetical protein VNL92_06140 [Dehalococcoidia bacterium]|nr:hypothetical protein [Dehalococcoidia bacterium]